MNREYYEALKYVWENGQESAPRGQPTKEVFSYTFRLDEPQRRLSTLEPLETKLGYGRAELDWYLLGTNKISDLTAQYQKIWHPFSDDGLTVNSSYGHRIFGEHSNMSVNQWQWCYKKLLEDPDTRQAVININSYFDKNAPTKDMPCCLGMQFFIRDGKLDMTVNFRSSDIVLGIRNDIYTMSALQELMAYQLNRPLGEFRLTSNSLHLYERDFRKAKDVLQHYHAAHFIYEDPMDELNIPELYEKHKDRLGDKV